MEKNATMMSGWKPYGKAAALILLAAGGGVLGSLFSGQAAWWRNGLFAAGLVAAMPALQRLRSPWTAAALGLAAALPAAIVTVLQIRNGEQPVWAPALFPFCAPLSILLLGAATAVLHHTRVRRNWSAWLLFPLLLAGGALAFVVRSLPYAQLPSLIPIMVSAAVFSALPLALILSLGSAAWLKLSAPRFTSSGRGLAEGTALLAVVLWIPGSAFFTSADSRFFHHFRSDQEMASAFSGTFQLHDRQVTFADGTRYLQEAEPPAAEELVLADGTYRVADGYVWRRRAAAAPERLFRGTAIARHPDGSLIYFDRDRFLRFRDGASTLFHRPRPLLPGTLRGVCLDANGTVLFYLCRLNWALSQHYFLTAVRLDDGRELTRMMGWSGQELTGNLHYQPPATGGIPQEEQP